MFAWSAGFWQFVFKGLVISSWSVHFNNASSVVSRSPISWRGEIWVAIILCRESWQSTLVRISNVYCLAPNISLSNRLTSNCLWSVASSSEFGTETPSLSWPRWWARFFSLLNPFRVDYENDTADTYRYLTFPITPRACMVSGTFYIQRTSPCLPVLTMREQSPWLSKCSGSWKKFVTHYGVNEVLVCPCSAGPTP